MGRQGLTRCCGKAILYFMAETKRIVLDGGPRDGMRVEVSVGLNEIQVLFIPDAEAIVGDEKPPFHHVGIRTQTYRSIGDWDEGYEIFRPYFKVESMPGTEVHIHKLITTDW